ncbi:hypothetical protein BVC80_1811g43 [Macleaya cordata]|uniref:Uncharacterized protein n=1 Tax=Macleaya cordata TaxID=56857 RepID=A0A200QVT4_MACCD|nr:hypothetical protein BVC80_1811g43 [Macleaya cordata]
MGELVESLPNFNVTVLSNDPDDDEIYEKIEAPKFVDLTAPDKSLQVDDRSWFCLRVGCDLKHEEDMDPETLYKNFVLRVMAARSPNLRFRKTLSKQAPSAKMKCPLSAPAKSSKRRLSRLTVITSLSQKLADAKVKVHPLCKLNLTPKGKATKFSIAAKALTTPRYKKCLPNQDPFRSVQNPKTNVSMPRNRVVAKALVFDSPKKTQRRKTSLEGQTPVTEICSEMKKLEINSQTNQSCKTLKSTARGPSKRPIASVPLKSKLSNQNSKKRVEVSRDHKDQEAKSLRRLKRKSKGSLRKSLHIVPQEGSVNDFSDMEIDEKSRNCSLDVCSVLGDSKSNEEHLIVVEENLDAIDAKQEEHLSSPEAFLNEDNRQAVSTDVARTVSSSEKDLVEKDPHKFPTSDIGKEESEGNEHEENVKSNVELEELDLKEKDVRMFGPSNRDGDEREAIQSDDKENASTSEDNRELNINDENSQRNISQNENSENRQKVNGPVGKSCKGVCTVTANGCSLRGKYMKTKPTNPKPFRLRTDERGILREAKLEKRLLLAPLREITPASKVSDGDLQRRHENEIERNEKSHGQFRHESNSQEGNQTDTDKRTKKIQHRQVKSKYLNTSNCATEPKMTTATIQRRKKVEGGEDKVAKTMESRTTTKSQLLREQLVRPQRVAGTRDPKLSRISLGRLSIIKEISSAVLRPKEAKQEKGGITATTNPAGRSTSRGRRPTTVPKEPNFHRIHTPKSCTKTPTKVISL